MSKPFDVIVVGLGAMGAAASYELARRGASVLGIERFDVPHAMGSSHGESRMIRMAYYEHPDYVPLLKRAYTLWDELENLTGKKLFHRTGGIYMGMPGGNVVPGTRRAAREHGLPHEELSDHELRKRWPMFRMREGTIGVWEPQAGFLRVEACVAAMADMALRHGAVIKAREGISSWRKDGNGIAVKTENAEYRAAKILEAVSKLPQGYQ